MDFSNINFLAVAVAAVASFAFGAIWYSQGLFGKTWQNELGFTDEDLKGANMGKIFGTTFVLTFVMALGMGILLRGHGENQIDWLSGLYHGLSVGLAFVGMSMGINYLYQRKSFKLWAIDAFYQIIILGIMGVIIGAWR
ncbi:DUF1761 domain-containing protein [Fulvivirgaceae bacterium BMA10]|uniref:DUF1761 domain-containing protein n=1 Tax=Splendidivirga corallicola TaxID=3051826 RepID=A0ABT8KVE3_9BACT|nr:DUF1761 domain-containing protein [Fulvivirgaceae bacterium BMA10]